MENVLFQKVRGICLLAASSHSKINLVTGPYFSFTVIIINELMDTFNDMEHICIAQL